MPAAWSVTSMTRVISVTDSRRATSIPWLKVTAAMPQPAQPPVDIREITRLKDQLTAQQEQLEKLRAAMEEQQKLLDKLQSATVTSEHLQFGCTQSP